MRGRAAATGIRISNSQGGASVSPSEKVGSGALAILTYIARVTSPLYNRDILRLAASIPHLGRLEEADARAERVSALCGSRVAVEVRIDAQGRVAELAQEVRACALGQAAASLMGADAVGRSAGELAQARDALAAYLTGTSEDPGAWPGIGVLEPARPYSARHASILLAFEAVAEAAALANQRLAEAGGG